MKKTPALLTLAIGLAFPLSAQQEGDWIRLLNGDRLHGRLHHLEAGLLRVQPAWGGDPLQIPARLLGESFHYTQEIPSATGTFTFELANGDHFHGEIVGLDEETLHLQLSWGQQTRLHRSAVTRITPRPRGGNFLLREPATHTAWTLVSEPGSPPQFPAIADGVALPARTPMSRVLRDVPGKAELRFSVTSQDFYTLSLGLGQVDHRNRIQGSEMRMNFAPGHVSFSQSDPRQHMNNLHWQLQTPLPPGDQQTHEFVLQINFANGDMHLLRGGQSINQWNNPFFAGMDPVPALQLRFTLNHSQQQVYLRNVYLSPWSGTIPPDLDHLPATDLTRIALVNGDMISAHWRGLENGRLLLELPDGSRIPVPLQRVVAILPPSAPDGWFRARNQDVHAILPGNQRLTLALHDLTPQTINTTGDAWADPLQIPRSHLERIRWNVHAHRRLDTLPLQPELFFSF